RQVKLLNSATAFVVVVGAMIALFTKGDHMARLKLAIGYGLLILIFLFGLMILLEIASGKIDLSLLLSETSGGASMSRFQLLIFTFVISLSFFLLVARSRQLPAIRPGVLTLRGITSSTYPLSRGTQARGG